MTGRLQRIVLAAAIVAALPLANAAERVDPDRMAACAEERNDARRLACYDDAVAATKPAPAKPAAPPASATPAAPPAAPAPAVRTESDFGVIGSSVARQRQEEQEQQQAESDKIESITARVAAVASRPHGELVITLDNGQVWAQKKTERYFAAKPGDAVTINAGMLGSYRMIIGNRSTHVTRIK